MKAVPQDILAERWTLGAMLQDNQVIDDVAMVLRPEDFYAEEHQTICRAIFDLRAEGKPATAVTMMDLLTRLSRDEHKLEMLESLSESVAHSYGAAQHAAIVRDKALKREMIAAFEGMAKKCYDDYASASELSDEAEAAIFAVTDQEAACGMVEAVVAVDESIAHSEVRANGHDFGLPTGIPDLDDILDGMQPGQLIVLAARPSVGKSALAINICDHIAVERGQSVLFFSMEMSRKEIGDRIISARGLIDGYKLKKGVNLTPLDKRVMREVRDMISRQRFGVDDTASRTLGQLAASIRRRVRKSGAVFACIDYLQLIDTTSGDRDSRQEQVAKMSRRLKMLAKQVGIPIMVLSQLNREGAKRDDPRPKLTDLRESGAIEQDADVVLLLHRPDMNDPDDNFRDRSARKCELIVAKNRGGARGTIALEFYRQWTKFVGEGELAGHPATVTTDPVDAPF
jgi:replicative DNA helicase